MQCSEFNVFVGRDETNLATKTLGDSLDEFSLLSLLLFPADSLLRFQAGSHYSSIYAALKAISPIHRSKSLYSSLLTRILPEDGFAGDCVTARQSTTQRIVFWFCVNSQFSGLLSIGRVRNGHWHGLRRLSFRCFLYAVSH
jgi:hypothetical protein